MGDDEAEQAAADGLAAWWKTLSDSQRRQAYAIGAHVPMPHWMVRSLADADVVVLVEAADRPEGILRPWFYMPVQVVKLVARRRRGDDSP